MLGILFFLAPVQQDRNLSLISYVVIAVEATQSFALRQRKLLLDLLRRCLEPKLCTGTYSRANVRSHLLVSGLASLTLVATNVAARGLDTNDVQLIIQGEQAILLLSCFMIPEGQIFQKSRESQVKFEHISAPQPLDIAKAVGQDAAEMVTKISDSVIPAFKSVAEEVLNTSGLSAVDLLWKALC